MRILVYKRTHNGDPDASGCFGIHDCMGSIRGRHFDAVIGVGGIGLEPKSHGIAGKVNWIGIGPRKTATLKRGPHVRFDRFVDFDTEGPNFSELAPNLARRMYSNNVRHIMDDFTPEQYREAITLLKLVNALRPSGRGRMKQSRVCRRLCGTRRLIQPSCNYRTR